MDETSALLEQLADITLPERSGLPLAPGWIALILLTLLLCLAALWYWRKRAPTQTEIIDWQTPALAELRVIEHRLQSGSGQELLTDCSKLARRISMARSQREEVAALTGQSWLQKLDQLSNSRFYSQGAGRYLMDAPYQAQSRVSAGDLSEIVAALRRLIMTPQEQNK